MKVRILEHVNHVRYKDIEVKNMDEAQEMINNNIVYEDYDKWEYGKSYDETHIEEIKEVK
tara:strand:+ start:41 stop:220 length:180 start_codon:yes stop_codon:yes gene_type:complete